MSWQFRKSKSLLGGLLRLTLGKRGLSGSVGVPGLRFSVGRKRRVHRTISIPGTGLFKRDRLR